MRLRSTLRKIKIQWWVQSYENVKEKVSCQHFAKGNLTPEEYEKFLHEIKDK
jgi:uncharacterized membrane protein